MWGEVKKLQSLQATYCPRRPRDTYRNCCEPTRSPNHSKGFQPIRVQEWASASVTPDGSGFCSESLIQPFKCTNLTQSSHVFWDPFWWLYSPFDPHQIYSSRDLEDNLNKIREICSDDKHDWDQRANAVSRFTLNSLFQFLFFFFWLLIVTSSFPMLPSAAEKDSLALSCRCSHLRLFLPASAPPRWSLQIIG